MEMRIIGDRMLTSFSYHSHLGERKDGQLQGARRRPAGRCAQCRDRDSDRGRPARRRGHGADRLFVPQLQGRPGPHRARADRQKAPDDGRDRLRRHGGTQRVARIRAGSGGGADRLGRRRAPSRRLRPAGAGSRRLAGAVPEGCDTKWAMALGTAGFTAMLCVIALERAGLAKDAGPVAVTGGRRCRQRPSPCSPASAKPSPSPGVPGNAAPICPRRRRGDRQGRAGGGAGEAARRALGRRRRTVGGAMLAHILAETRYGGAVAACGLAGGAGLKTTVMPFILRGVTLLGIESVYCPPEPRQAAWQRLAQDLPREALDAMTEVVPLDQVAARERRHPRRRRARPHRGRRERLRPRGRAPIFFVFPQAPGARSAHPAPSRSRGRRTLRALRRAGAGAPARAAARPGSPCRDTPCAAHLGESSARRLREMKNYPKSTAVIS